VESRVLLLVGPTGCASLARQSPACGPSPPQRSHPLAIQPRLTACRTRSTVCSNHESEV
jgi:hypothetical protein